MKDNKFSDVMATIVGLLAVFGYPLYMIIVLLLDGELGALVVLIAFFVIVALAAGAKDAFSPIEIPKNDAVPPPGLAKMEKQSPGGIETQKFEGGYDGSLNKDFENK